MTDTQETRSTRVLVVCDGTRGPSATQKISFEQPFDAASASFVEIVFQPDLAQFAIVPAFEAQRPDLLVLSRYTSPRGADWVKCARGAGIPVIFHIDDDLLAVPASLGEAKHQAYNDPERLSALRGNIDASDIVYVSTSELGKRFREHGVRPPVLEGDVYCSVAPDDIGALIGPATGPVIGYMGTSGHSTDLAMIMPAVCGVMERVEGLQFEVFGTIAMPPELTRFGNRVRHLPPMTDYRDFIPRLRSLGWWIGLAPLEDNAFNRCKADTKWVEYSLAGMGVIASDLPVYHRACADQCGILATSEADWREALLNLLYRPELREATVKRAQHKLRQAYTHERLRAQVMDVFDRARNAAR
jgi:hypothetical protein